MEKYLLTKVFLDLFVILPALTYLIITNTNTSVVLQWVIEVVRYIFVLKCEI